MARDSCWVNRQGLGNLGKARLMRWIEINLKRHVKIRPVRLVAGFRVIFPPRAAFSGRGRQHEWRGTLGAEVLLQEAADYFFPPGAYVQLHLTCHQVF